MTEKHSNFVGFDSELVTDGEYIKNSLVVSKGQPFKPDVSFWRLGSDPTSTVWMSDVYSGRHKSKPPRDAFLNAVGGDKHVHSNSATFRLIPYPDELNFSFGLKLTFGNTQRVIWLGQGSSWGTNDWWLGSPSYVKKSDGGGYLDLGSHGNFALGGYIGRMDSFVFTFIKV